MSKVDPKYRFDVAISFAGETSRAKVRSVASILRAELGEGRVFFDEWFEQELAGHDANVVLQKIYGTSTQLVVACVCQRYDEKPWTQEEWRAIQSFERDLRDAGTENRKRLRFLPLRFGDGEIDGLFKTAIAPDVRDRSPEEIADLILKRLRSATETVQQQTDLWGNSHVLHDATIKLLRSSVSNEAMSAARRLRRMDDLSEAWKADPNSATPDSLNQYVLAVGGYDFKQPNVRLCFLVIDYVRSKCLATTSEQGKDSILLSHSLILVGSNELPECFGSPQSHFVETKEGSLLFLVVEALDADCVSKLFPNSKWVDTSEHLKNAEEHDQLALEVAADLARRHQNGRNISTALQLGPRLAVKYLKGRLIDRDVEGHIGWTSMPASKSVGCVSTAQGVLCHVYAGIQIPQQDAIIRSIINMQNQDGGWPVKKALRGKSTLSITESSLLSLEALRTLGHTGPEVDRCLRWLGEMQDHTGGWPSAKRSARSRVYPTALAVRTLAKFATTTQSVKRGEAWMLEAQNIDGGWGEYPKDGCSMPAYTAHAILSLHASGLGRPHESLERACNFISLDADVNHRLIWENCSDSDSVDDDAELHFIHFSLPWCVSALLRTGLPLHDRVISEAIYRLTSMQAPEGYWDSSRTVHRQAPLWETHDAIHALSVVQSATVDNFEKLMLGESSFRRKEASNTYYA